MSGVFIHFPEVSHVWIDGRSVVYEGKVRTLAVDLAATAPKQQGVGAWGRVGVENIDKRHVRQPFTDQTCQSQESIVAKLKEFRQSLPSK